MLLDLALLPPKPLLAVHVMQMAIREGGSPTAILTASASPGAAFFACRLLLCLSWLSAPQFCPSPDHLSIARLTPMNHRSPIQIPQSVQPHRAARVCQNQCVFMRSS